MRRLVVLVFALVPHTSFAALPLADSFAEAMSLCSSPVAHLWVMDHGYESWRQSYLSSPPLIAAAVPFASAEGVAYLQQRLAAFPKRYFHGGGGIERSCIAEILSNASIMLESSP